ncbi:unnamed protein product, partial [Meganyctiphanes norvegica]
ERQAIFQAFKKLVYSKNENDFQSAKEGLEALESFQSNDLLKTHYDHLMNRKSEWSILCRTDLITRGNDTNNYAEATMRIFKEVILGRCRLYNPAELVSYIFKGFEDYHVLRISDFMCNFRKMKVKLGNDHLPENEVKSADISKSENGDFIVKSQSEPGLTYVIDTRHCTCTCPAGQSGSICKHLVGVHVHTDATMFTFPPMSVDDRNIYHVIAFGNPSSTNWYVAVSNKQKVQTISSKAIIDATVAAASPQTQISMTSSKAIIDATVAAASPQTQISMTSSKAIIDATVAAASPQTQISMTSSKAIIDATV